jgi:transposase
VSVVEAETSLRVEELEALVAQMQGQLAATGAQLAATSKQLAGVVTERDNLRRAYRQLMEQFELLRRRLFIAKAERADATQLELEFEKTKRQLDALAHQLGGEAIVPGTPTAGDADDAANSGADAAAKGKAQQAELGSRPSGNGPKKANVTPKGRRNLANADDLPQQRIEIRDPELEASGATFVDWELSYKLGFKRPVAVRIVFARAKYKVAKPEPAQDKATVLEQDGSRFTIVTAPLPPLLIRRGLLAPSMLARVIVQKFRFGMPYFRQEEQLDSDGIALDRGTMSRSSEEIGACLGAIVLACRDDAIKNAFCLSTDATGIAIRPEPLPDGRRQPCRRGHFFVVLADKKHVFFEFQAKHTGAVVCEMFRGFSGYMQADAHAIYDALFRGEAVDDATEAPTEVACWSHVRRRFWEAAVSGFAVGREGLLRIRHLYQLDQGWADSPPAARLQKRKTVLAPLVDEFFHWIRAQDDPSSQIRGLVKKALGYAERQERALRRFLEDGRLRMDNNLSENALRTIATGRKAFLFFGSDDTAEAAANLYSLIASCKLHGIDPELYLAEVIRLMPYWPRTRFLELAPAYWAQTRSRLDPKELEAELGPVTVPPILAATAEQAASS